MCSKALSGSLWALMRGDIALERIRCGRCLKRGLNRSSFGLGREGTPLPSGIDSERSMPKMKPIAVEALGRHLKGTDASVPFSFGGFFGYSGKTQGWNLVYTVSIPLRSFSRVSSWRRTACRSGRIFSKHMRSDSEGKRDSPAGTELSIRMHLRCPCSESVTT